MSDTKAYHILFTDHVYLLNCIPFRRCV